MARRELSNETTQLFVGMTDTHVRAFMLTSRADTIQQRLESITRKMSSFEHVEKTTRRKRMLEILNIFKTVELRSLATAALGYGNLASNIQITLTENVLAYDEYLQQKIDDSMDLNQLRAELESYYSAEEGESSSYV